MCVISGWCIVIRHQIIITIIIIVTIIDDIASVESNKNAINCATALVIAAAPVNILSLEWRGIVEIERLAKNLHKIQQNWASQKATIGPCADESRQKVALH